MTRANDVHDVLSPAVIEQITRWAVTDEWSGRGPADYAATAVNAANKGTPEHFRAAVAGLAEHDGPGSRAAALQATLWGNVDATLPALADNEGLRALLRTAAQQAEGRDVAEIATPNGLRLRAEQTGEAYQTAVFVEDVPGRSDVLASDTITAATATEALRTAAEREHAVHGLDRSDLQLVDQQLARLEQITADPQPATPTPAPQTPPEPDAWWADTVTQLTGRDLRAEPGWTTLATTLDRAAAAGWDVAGQLPATVAQAPLPGHGSVSHDLAYRVMDACPDAVPPAPSVAQINGAEAPSSGRQREPAERAIRATPAP
ncbi:MAG: hypothetical protein J0H43_06950, partial [Actinobacteria bacterium]|nr:hypothetical protein [Actinomycetota bacterium]